MPRIRSLKPDFFIDDKLAEQKPLTRILFQGLWCLADKEGRLEDNPKKIKVQVLPYDNFDVEDGLTSLSEAGFIIRYQVEGKRFIQIKNFKKHQNPHHTEKDSEIPAPNGALTVKEPLKNGEATVVERRGSEMNTTHKQELVNHEPETMPPKTKKTISIDQYMEELKSDPAYQHINLDWELSKMRRWVKDHPDRKMSKAFVRNWLNKIEPPLEVKNGNKNTGRGNGSVVERWAKKNGIDIWQDDGEGAENSGISFPLLEG